MPRREGFRSHRDDRDDKNKEKATRAKGAAKTVDVPFSGRDVLVLRLLAMARQENAYQGAAMPEPMRTTINIPVREDAVPPRTLADITQTLDGLGVRYTPHHVNEQVARWSRRTDFVLINAKDFYAVFKQAQEPGQPLDRIRNAMEGLRTGLIKVTNDTLNATVFDGENKWTMQALTDLTTIGGTAKRLGEPPAPRAGRTAPQPER